MPRELSTDAVSAGINDHFSGSFTCDNYALTTLEGCPRNVGGNFSCSRNDQLATLEHAPKTVGGDFVCNGTNIKSLKGIHKIVDKITKNQGKNDGHFYFRNNRARQQSHFLGLLLIKGLNSVELDNRDVEAIINKYLPNEKGVVWVSECQNEIEYAGFEDYAKL